MLNVDLHSLQFKISVLDLCSYDFSYIVDVISIFCPFINCKLENFYDFRLLRTENLLQMSICDITDLYM